MKMTMFAAAMLLSLNFSVFAAEGTTETFKIDDAHSSVMYKINHLGFSDTYGHFTKFEGEVKFDEKVPANNSITMSVDAASISTHNDKRDGHLKGADFFDVKQFPKITFKSDSVKKSGNSYDVKGQFTMHGVTKPVAFKFNRSRTDKDPMGSIRTGGYAEFKIKRSDYGMNYMQGANMLGDEVTIMISAEGIKQ